MNTKAEIRTQFADYAFDNRIPLSFESGDKIIDFFYPKMCAENEAYNQAAQELSSQSKELAELRAANADLDDLWDKACESMRKAMIDQWEAYGEFDNVPQPKRITPTTH